jgi:hypothetical protein
MRVTCLTFTITVVVEAHGSSTGSGKRSVLVAVPVGASRSTVRRGVVRRERLTQEFAAVEWTRYGL